MATFLDDISVYNAKASLVIAEAVTAGNTDRANMMSSLKTTANDTTLSEAVRLNALTALINLGGLLDVPLPPYFPLTVTYANTQTYVGIHDDLTGLQGGAPGDYQHITTAQLNSFLGKASLNDITFANLQGVYSDNASLQAAIDGKQNELNGVGFVKINGNQSTITYDNSTYLSTISGIVVGGELTGTLPNPGLLNNAVISKVLTGWNGSAAYSTITSSDTILSGMEKLNARISQIIASPVGVASLTASTNTPAVLNVAASSPTGNVTFSVDFDSQAQNRVMASPNGSSGVPGFRSLVTNDLPSSSVTPGTYGSASLIPIITVDAKGRVTFAVNAAAAAGGQVNTVALTGPGIFDSFTSTGAANVVLGFGLVNQVANTVWAGPTTGASADPTFRSLVQDDIPTIDIAKVNGLSATLSTFLTNQLANSTMYVGNGSDAAVNAAVAGDLTMAYVNNSGTNEANFTIANGVVTYAKIQDVTSGKLLGRYAATNGVVQNLTLDPAAFTLNTSTGVIGLVSPIPPLFTAKGDLLTYTGTALTKLSIGANATILMADTAAATGNKWVAMSGDVSIATTGATTIANSAVTLAKMADLPAYRVIGNDTSGTLAPKALTKAELTTLVNQFTPSLAGIVPASGGGTANFLRADGSWAPASGGGTTTNALTIGSGLSGTAATFNGSAAVTISLNTGNANTWTALQTFQNNIYLGAVSGSAGSARFLGSTSGYVILQAPAAPANQTYTLPTAYPAASSGYYLTSTTGGTLSWAAVSGTGDVVGPAGATPNAIAVFNGSTGLIIKDSGVTFPIGVNNGGIGITSGASGGILFFDSTSSIGSSLVLAANALVVGGGAGIAPSTITTGVGVVTALGISVGTSGSFVTNGGALGTPLSGNFSSGTFTWPTFNQNTTGSAASLTTARDIQTNLASTSAASFNGTANIQPGVTGTLPVGNGGTGISTATAYAVICAGTTSTGAFQNVSGLGTSGQVLTSNGAGALPTWQTVAGGASSLTTLSAATATASISNANSIITWNWSSNTTQNAFVLNSTSLTTGSLLSVTHATSALTGNLATITSTGVTTGNLLNLGISGSTATSADNLVITNTGTANTSGRGIDVSISGATNSGNTFAAVLSNTKTGTASTNTAVQLTASGGTTNYAIDVTAGISRFAAGTAATPQLILTPSTAAGGTTFTGTVNGSIWYDTNSTGTANSSLTLYKDTGYTKIITKDRNPDFATGSASGVLVADTSGTITKSADLTALGIFSVYADAASITGTAATTMIGTSLVGSTTLPANFFGLGKTIRIYASGDITSANGDDTAITFKLGATTVGTFNIDNLHSTTANDWYLEAYIICNATGASGTVRVGATFFAEGTTPSGGHSWYLPVTTSSTINTTTSLAIDVLNDFVQTGMTMNVKFMTCYYLN